MRNGGGRGCEGRVGRNSSMVHSQVRHPETICTLSKLWRTDFILLILPRPVGKLASTTPSDAKSPSRKTKLTQRQVPFSPVISQNGVWSACPQHFDHPNQIYSSLSIANHPHNPRFPPTFTSYNQPPYTCTSSTYCRPPYNTPHPHHTAPTTRSSA